MRKGVTHCASYSMWVGGGGMCVCKNLFLSPQPPHCEHAYSCLEVVFARYDYHSLVHQGHTSRHITITIDSYTKGTPQGTL